MDYSMTFVLIQGKVFVDVCLGFKKVGEGRGGVREREREDEGREGEQVREREGRSIQSK